MSNDGTEKQDESPEGIPFPDKYPAHHPDPARIGAKVLAVIKKVLEGRRSNVFTKD